jgi:putative membrane protein
MRRLILGGAAAAALALAPAGATASGTSALDRVWLQQSGRTALFEIAGARIASPRATTPAAKELATRIDGDHARALNAIGHVAKQLHVGLPGTPTATQHWELHVLTTLQGASFDRMYTWLVEAQHVEAIADAQEVAGHGSSPAVRALAKSLLPTLRAHLQMAAAAKKAAG